MEFTIPGEPKAKQRPRVVSRNGFSRAYTPRETVVYENLVRMEYERQVGYKFPDDAAIVMSITAYYSIPKSASKKRRQEMEQGAIMPTKKPDLDNIMKSIADSLNGIAYRDDSQIVSCSCTKLYSENPCVRVVLKEAL